MNQKGSTEGRVLGVFVLAMMNVAIIASLRALPLMAKEGLCLVFFFVAAAVMSLIPTALVSAELATGWSRCAIPSTITRAPYSWPR